MNTIPPVPDRNTRLGVCKLLISICRDVSTDIFGTNRNWGADLDACVIGCAVLVGHAEGRPMTAHKLALYLKMPRATVVRKLKLLANHGVIIQSKGLFFVSPNRMKSDRTLLTKIVNDIKAAAR